MQPQDGVTEYPRARRAGIEMSQVDDELLVYDSTARAAHCLNGAAALVWQACDGATSISDIAARLAADTGSAVDVDVVLYALGELSGRGLLEAGESLPTGSLRTRRDVLMKLGGAIVAAPIITSVLAPSAAAAASASSSSGSSGGSGTGFSSGGSGSSGSR